MGLFTTWSSTNRVIKDDLASSFTREDIASTDSDVFIYGGNIAAAYYKYTRTRTKVYSYIGMSHSVATRCCAAMHALYSRFVYRWEWDSTNRIWKMKSSTTNRDYEIVQGGTAALEHATGDIWHVNVMVNEQITIPYRQLINSTPEPAATMPYPWRAFEENPSIRTDYFRGRAATSTEQQYGLLYDFDYDERSVGWGSDEDPYHTDFHTPTS